MRLIDKDKVVFSLNDIENNIENFPAIDFDIIPKQKESNPYGVSFVPLNKRGKKQ